MLSKLSEQGWSTPVLLSTPMQWLSRDSQPSHHSRHRGQRTHNFCTVLIIAPTDLPGNAAILALHSSENSIQVSISNPACFWGRNDTFKCIQKPGLWPKEIIHPFISTLLFCSYFIFAQFCQISSIFIYMHSLAPKVTEVIKARPVMSAALTDVLEFKQDNSGPGFSQLELNPQYFSSLHNYPSCSQPQKNLKWTVFKWPCEFARWILQFSLHMPSTNVLPPDVPEDHCVCQTRHSTLLLSRAEFPGNVRKLFNFLHAIPFGIPAPKSNPQHSAWGSGCSCLTIAQSSEVQYDFLSLK